MRNLQFETVPASKLSEKHTITDRLKVIRQWQEQKGKKHIEFITLNLNNYDNQDLYLKLETIANNIEILKCKGNGLTELPPLPDTLTHLDARYNRFNHKEKKRIIKECYRKAIIINI